MGSRLRHLRWSTMALAALVAPCASPCWAAEDAARLPGALVYLRQVDPTIQQDIKYATADNFTGRVVPGYAAGECILLRPAAEALAKVQADLRKVNLALKVYDCFRPTRAVRAFMRWSDDEDPGTGDRRFRPRTARDDLVSLGYIARTSKHSKGVAVDLTIVPASAPEPAPYDAHASYGACNGPASARAPDNSVDMGTGYDCFDVMSHTHAQRLTPEQQAARAQLLQAMSAHGFRNYPREWWHFTYDGAGGQLFDFEIAPYRGGK